MTPPVSPAGRQPLSPAEHRTWVEARFSRFFPQLVDGAWEYGLVLLHAPSENGLGQVAVTSVHRSSCPIVAQVAALPEENSSTPVLPVHSSSDVLPGRPRCSTCHTDTLPDGALYWGDNEADVVFREGLDRLSRRITTYRRLRADAATQAREQAEKDVLAEHATEVAMLTEVYHQRHLADLTGQFPDVVVHLLANNDPELTG